MSPCSFKYVRNNVYLTRNVKKIDEDNRCGCSRDKTEKIGCQENCINRQLYIECGYDCSLGRYCGNKKFQKHEYGQCSKIATGQKGFGLQADEDISADKFLIEYVGEVLDKTQFNKRSKEYSSRHDSYFMQLNAKFVIDATKKGNKARFINHSCDANARAEKWIVNGKHRIGIFSRKLIKKHEEITINYNWHQKAQKCFCGSPKCRGWIGKSLKTET